MYPNLKLLIFAGDATDLHLNRLAHKIIILKPKYTNRCIRFTNRIILKDINRVQYFTVVKMFSL